MGFIMISFMGSLIVSVKVYMMGSVIQLIRVSNLTLCVKIPKWLHHSDSYNAPVHLLIQLHHQPNNHLHHHTHCL